MLQINQDVLGASMGAGIGIVIPTVLKEYVQKIYGPTIPVISDFIPDPFSKWSVFVPLVTGIPSLLIGLFYRSKYGPVALGYGLASTCMGVLNIAFEPTVRARAMGARPRQIRPVARIRSQQMVTGSRPLGKGAPRLRNGLTETGISGKVIVA